MCSFCARASGDVTGERRVEGGGGSSGKGGDIARDLEDGGGGVATSCGKGGGVEGPLEDGCGGVAEASGGTERDAGLCSEEGGGGRREGIAEGRIVCAAPELGGGRLDALDGTTDERLCDGTTDERLCDGTTDERLCDGTTDERLACGALAAGAGWLGEVEERDGGGGCGRTEGRGGVSSSENGVIARAETGGGAGVAGREVEAGGGVGVDPDEADCVWISLARSAAVRASLTALRSLPACSAPSAARRTRRTASSFSPMPQSAPAVSSATATSSGSSASGAGIAALL